MFELIDAKRWFLSKTPDLVSTAVGSSRPRIVIAAAFKNLIDGTTTIASNTHYDHLHDTEGLLIEGEREAGFLEQFASDHACVMTDITHDGLGI